MALVLLFIALLTNFPLRYIHSILYVIARSVPTGLNIMITSSFFLGSMNEARFKKSLARWNPFTEAVDLEVCSHMHDGSVFLLSENLGRIAKMSCPPELDMTLRDAPKILTQILCFRMSSMDSKSKELRKIARVLGRGSLNTGALVCQVFHWFYVGAPRATTSYVQSLYQRPAVE